MLLWHRSKCWQQWKLKSIMWEQLQLSTCQYKESHFKDKWSHDTCIFIMGTRISVRKVFILKLVLHHISKTHLYEVQNLICAARHYIKAIGRYINSPVCVSGRRWCQAEPLDYNRIQSDIRMNGQHWPAKLISMNVHHNLYRLFVWFLNYTYIVWLFCFPHMLEAVSSNQIDWEWIS